MNVLDISNTIFLVHPSTPRAHRQNITYSIIYGAVNMKQQLQEVYNPEILVVKRVQKKN